MTNSTTPDVQTLLPARDEYQNRYDQAQAKIAALQIKLTRMVWVRTALFLAATGLLLLGYLDASAPGIVLVVGWIAAACFVASIVVHEHFRLDKLQQKSAADLYQQLLARLDRNWKCLPDAPLLAEFQDLPSADDLDIAGPSSLLSLLSLAVSRPGRRQLQAWLAEPPSWEEIQTRQAASQTLLPHRTLRLSIVSTTRACSDGSEDVYGLPRWAESSNWLASHRVAHILSYAGPALVLVGLLTWFYASLPDNSGWSNIAAGLIGSGFAINILLTIFWGSWLHEIFQQVTGQHKAVYGFSSVFDSLAGLPSDGGLLDSVRQTTTEGKTCATRGFSKLLGLVRLANLQRDPAMYIVYLVLQLTLAWDFRILKLFEGWKNQFGKHVSGWFEALGTAEAVISVSTLADGHPDWKLPQPCDDPHTILKAESLGHPLLPTDACVHNDLSMADDFPLLLVTGSNMAGKSTFMRALGLNLLLSRTGSPVCAVSLKTRSFEVATSIRVRDSLREGVSFFMAELKRLKEVVDQAAAHAASDKPPLFFLLDEILQGTNSRERQIAVASVLNKLNRYGACGVLSTHDLDLASDPDVLNIAQIVHFREYFDTVDGVEQMRFDYKMHPGTTPTTNALKLLDLVGLR